MCLSEAYRKKDVSSSIISQLSVKRCFVFWQPNSDLQLLHECWIQRYLSITFCHQLLGYRPSFFHYQIHTPANWFSIFFSRVCLLSGNHYLWHDFAGDRLIHTHAYIKYRLTYKWDMHDDACMHACNATVSTHAWISFMERVKFSFCQSWN